MRGVERTGTGRNQSLQKKAEGLPPALRGGNTKEAGHKLTWQQGYGAFSVSVSVCPVVVRYIQNQEAHHKKMSFDAEFTALLKRHGVEFDPRYVLG